MKKKRRQASPNGAGLSSHRTQFGALPIAREPDGTLGVMLVTSRETKRWIIPKGWPIPGLEPHEVAAREAYEEAGLVGEIGQDPLGSYTYEKRLKRRGSVTCVVEVFPLEVRERLPRWPEMKERETRWFGIEEAASAVTEEALSAILRGLAPAAD